MPGWGPFSATVLPVHPLGQVTLPGLLLCSCSVFALVETKLQKARTASPHGHAASRLQPLCNSCQRGKQPSLAFPASFPSSEAQQKLLRSIELTKQFHYLGRGVRGVIEDQLSL